MAIWIVRHGATEWSKDGRHTGVTDLPLTEEGEQQARDMGKRLRGHEFERVLCSPLQRTRRTAELAGFGDRAEIEDRLVEVDYGQYDGKTTEEIREKEPHWALYRDGSPDGESPSQLLHRMDELLEEIGEPEGDVLMFGHGHCLRAFAVRYLGLELVVAQQLAFDAGHLSILGVVHDHPTIELWNHPAGRPEDHD